MYKNITKNWIYIFVISIIICLTIWLYFKTFNSYFFQDDWYSFSISQAKSIKDLLTFFWPQTNVIYYRPLGMQLPFFVFWKLFGINPLPFRIATLFVHFINGILIYKLLNFFLKNKKLALFGAFLYLTSSIHMIVFYWAATIAFVLAPLFYFASFYNYILNRKSISFGLFIIGILVNEILITLPFFISVWELFFIKRKKNIFILFYWVIVLIYVLYRLFIAKFPTTGGYAFLTQINQFFMNLRNYILWSLNWPEEVHKQFMSFFILNPEFIKNFFKDTMIFTLSSFLFILILIIIPVVYLLLKKCSIKNSLNDLILGILWFGVALSPVLFFAKHYYSYYLPIPFFGILLFSLTLTNLLIKQKSILNKYYWLLIFVIISWFLSAQTNIRFNQYVHWAPQRAVKSEKLVKKIQALYPNLPYNANVIIGEEGGTEENKWALGDQSGLQIIYNNPSLKTIFINKQDYLINKNKLLLPTNSTDMINYDL